LFLDNKGDKFKIVFEHYSIMKWRVFFHKNINLIKARLIIPFKIRRRADRLFDRTIKEFKKKHKRKPKEKELFGLVVKTSHRVIGIKSSRRQRLRKLGHFERQWIRKYLLLKNNIRDKYKIQPVKEKIK